MKKQAIYTLMFALMVTTPMVGRAQNATNDHYYDLFCSNQIHYSQVPENVFPLILAKHFTLSKTYDPDHDSRYLFRKIFGKNYQTLHSMSSFNYRKAGNVEVREGSGGDVYTWPAVCCSKDNHIKFYAKGVAPSTNSNSYTIIHGMQVSPAHAHMNSVKIGDVNNNITACFEEPNINKAELITPKGYLYFGQKKYLLLSYTVSYPQVQDIVYTDPKSVLIAGQLFEVNNGVNYDVRMNDVAGLSVIETKTAQVVKGSTIHLKGIGGHPRIKYKGDMMYYYNASEFQCKLTQSYENGNGLINASDIVMSQNGQPIYLLGINKDTKDRIDVITKIIPGDGDVVFDMQELPNYICYCGTNRKHGYVGYDNPILVILDKNTKQEVARYNGNRGSGGKDRFFTEMYVLDNDHLLLIYNDYHFRGYATLYSKDDIYSYRDKVGKKFFNSEYGQLLHYEIVSISSLIGSTEPTTSETPSPSTSDPASIKHNNQETTYAISENPDEIFEIVEVMPSFPGGEQKLAQYIDKNIKYPQVAKEKGIQGRVFVDFIVEPDGSVSNVKAVRGIGGGCDEEAVRVIQSMPKWNPGKQRGNAVRVSYRLPVVFKP